MKLVDGREFDTTEAIEGVRYNAYGCPGIPENATRLERGTCNCHGVGPDGLFGSADGTRRPAHLAGCPANEQRVVPAKVDHWLLSMDVDDGVTPFMVTCPDHGLSAESAFYPKDLVLRPSLWPVRMIWRKATQAELKRERREGGDHFARGGLAREWVGGDGVLAPVRLPTPSGPMTRQQRRWSERHG